MTENALKMATLNDFLTGVELINKDFKFKIKLDLDTGHIMIRYFQMNPSEWHIVTSSFALAIIGTEDWMVDE